MKTRNRAFTVMLILSLSINLLVSPFAALAAALPVIDDFETGLPSGTDTNGTAIGFITFNDPNSTVAISTTAAPPAPVPGAGSPNNVLKMDLNVVSFAGFVHNFENTAVDTWVLRTGAPTKGSPSSC